MSDERSFEQGLRDFELPRGRSSRTSMQLSSSGTKPEPLARPSACMLEWAVSAIRGF